MIRRIAHTLRYLLRRPKPVPVAAAERRGIVYMTQPIGLRCPCGSTFCDKWADA
jgi:hypothetical protein